MNLRNHHKIAKLRAGDQMFGHFQLIGGSHVRQSAAAAIAC